MFGKGDENGFMLLEAAAICGIIIGLAGSFYFFKNDRYSLADCEARIAADFAAQESLDKLSIFGKIPESRSFYSNNKTFNVSEKVEIINGIPNRCSTVTVSWKSMDGKNDLSITRQRKWQAE